jgi:hypothetical protein
MADHEWGSADAPASGAAKGSAGGADGGRLAGADAPNVVPFPRDWFGSVDELVPIELDPPEAGPNAAAAFWDGDAGVGEDAAEASGRREQPGTPAAAAGSDQTQWARRSRPPTRPRRSVGWKLVVVALLALVLGGAAALLLTGNGASRGADDAGHQRQRFALNVRTETVTAPVTVTATMPVRSHGHRRRRNSATTPRITVATRRATAQSQLSSSASTAGAGSEGPVVATSQSKDGGSSESMRDRKSGRASAGCAESPDSGCLP